MTFYVGQKVVCVDASNMPGARWRANEAPVEGQVYTVMAVRVTREGLQVLQLRELDRCEAVKAWVARNIGKFAGYDARRFRPVVERKTDISVFKAMLNPAPDLVDAQ